MVASVTERLGFVWKLQFNRTLLNHLISPAETFHVAPQGAFSAGLEVSLWPGW